jgi:hypothetical protein
MVAQFSKGSIIESTRFEGFSPKEGKEKKERRSLSELCFE